MLYIFLNNYNIYVAFLVIQMVPVIPKFYLYINVTAFHKLLDHLVFILTYRCITCIINVKNILLFVENYDFQIRNKFLEQKSFKQNKMGRVLLNLFINIKIIMTFIIQT